LSREEVIKRTITSDGDSKFRARRKGSKDMLLLVMIHTRNCHVAAKIHGQEREINVCNEQQAKGESEGIAQMRVKIKGN
jgi:hypothetical protein